jgi:ABC-type bacteriocin/lantibiotic exporter with double-glycine peptidase domain
MLMKTSDPQRRFFISEVVQTSNMDCGPASLKCLLGGFGIDASYGRLREACQASLDGSSINTLEQVAVQLGLEAEQVMLPLEYVLLSEARALPAIAVVRNAQGFTHFVVLWRYYGGFIQVMDPAVGRRWLTPMQLQQWLYIHALAVGAAEWREWASSEESLGCLRRGLAGLDLTAQQSNSLITTALSDSGWQSLAGLQACVRMVGTMTRSTKLKGERTFDLLDSLVRQARGTNLAWEKTLAQQNWPTVPVQYWSVLPAPSREDGVQQLLLRGAVLVRVRGHRGEAKETRGSVKADHDSSDLSPELSAALSERPDAPVRELLRSLRSDGLLEPVVLAKALLLGSAAVMVQAILFRSLLDIGGALDLADQRVAAVGVLAVLMLGMLVLNFPVAIGALRMGRHLETRLRIALLKKLSRLDDRYFRSRLISDMAERSHSVDTLRSVPQLGIQLLGSTFQLIMTVAGIIWLDPSSAFLAILSGLAAIALPLLMQPALAERGLRVRNHVGALSRFYLDAMLGLVPVRVHGSQHALRYTHEKLLVEWGRAALGLQRIAVSLGGIQFLVCTGLAVWLFLSHLGQPSAAGKMLLLMFWALSVPGLGASIASSICQYPTYRNIMVRLWEPLGAPERAESSTSLVPVADRKPKSSAKGVSIDLSGVTLSASGHTILEQVDLAVDGGSHIAIVGASGAGKSSLVGLLLGWAQPSKGVILIDGEPLHSDRLNQLRQETAWVDPSVQLWNRSLEYNLRYGAPNDGIAGFGQLIESAELHQLLEGLNDGLQSVLGEGGALVSAGEGQRIRLGRAMLRHRARLVILDEPFAALDRPRRERLLSKARELWRHATFLYVTHDISEAAAFGRVLVVENGTIVEDGAPDELLHQDGSRFRAMYDSDVAVQKRFKSNKFWRKLRIAQSRSLRESRRRLESREAASSLEHHTPRQNGNGAGETT